MTPRRIVPRGLCLAICLGLLVPGAWLAEGQAVRARGPVKPQTADTIRASIYADNWFVLFVNGKMVAVDPIDFLPHNVVSIDLLPEYPMTIAVMAKDNADPATGMEYGDQIGDGGFILRFADGTVTDANWKAKSFFRGPLAGGRIETTPIPADWFAPSFDDRAWPQAKVFPAAQVRPPSELRAADFVGAQFIWSDDLGLDNTVIFRTRVERPGWNPAWTTTPDLDVRGAPLR